MHRRRLECDGTVPPVSRRARGGNDRRRGRRARYRDRAARGLADRRRTGRAARQPQLLAAGRGGADPRRAFDLGRSRLPRHRPRACLAARYWAHPIRLDHRPRGARSVPAVEPHGRHHPGARAGACAGPRRQDRPDLAARPSDRDEHVRPRRQGHLRRRRPSQGQAVSSRRSAVSPDAARVSGGKAGGRIAARFAALREEGRAGLVTYLTAGDPDRNTSARLFAGLPAAGADLVEIGMPFSDPMADGPVIQQAGQRALKAGMNLRRTLALVRDLRRGDDATPIVLMGYYNPIYRYGAEAFPRDAVDAGADGVIVVDLPPEEDAELAVPAHAAGLDVIRLATPTSDERRLPRIVAHASGFLYYVAIAGITGTRSADSSDIAVAVARLRRFTRLPVGVGFGIRTPEQAAAVARAADAAVVGTALVQRLTLNLEPDNTAKPGLVDAVLADVRALATGVREARM